MPRRLLLTAGRAVELRRQLGFAAGSAVEPLDLADLPLTDGVRRQLQNWAGTFVDLHIAGSPDDDAARRWAQQGPAVAAAVARELGPDVQLRYLAHGVFSPGAGHFVVDPIAGLFDDKAADPPRAAQIGRTAYQSMLTLEFGGAGVQDAAPEPWLTAHRTDATDDELREMRRRAVDPVVRSLLTPDELTGARVIVHRDDTTRGIDLWLAAGGEEMRHRLWHPGSSGQLPDPVDMAAHLADSMEDWVCETKFAWGQRRVARYEVPPPR